MNKANSLFVFPYLSNFSSTQIEELKMGFSKFFALWNAHGKPLNAKFWTEENQFILVEVAESLTQTTGCSKDSLFKFVFEIQNELKLISGPLNKFYIKSEEKIRILGRDEIEKGLESGTLNHNNEVFPTWITSLGDYNELWGKPISAFAKTLRLKTPA
jgi:hypothetical protein